MRIASNGTTPAANRSELYERACVFRAGSNDTVRSNPQAAQRDLRTASASDTPQPNMIDSRSVHCTPPSAGKEPAAFANPDVTTASWFVVGRSAALSPGTVQTATVGSRRLALYRTDTGKPHVLDARCPHLGADLGQGSVDGDRLQCPFHHWQFGPDGWCRHAPGHARTPERRTRSVPVQEKHGLVWAYLGGGPAFAVPGPPNDTAWWTLRPPSQTIECHPHLVIANGLDTNHFTALHGMKMTAEPELTVDAPHRVTVTLQGRPTSNWLRWLTGTRTQSLRASFTTIGGHLAWTAVQAPVRFYVLFTARPTPGGRTRTQVVFFLPRTLGADLVRAVASMYVLLHDDRRILDNLDFTGSLTDEDSALQAFATLVNDLQRL